MCNFLIIAGSSDIGYATASLLTSAKHKVHLTARNPSSIQAAADNINATTSALDATDFEAVMACFQEAEAKMGTIDGVVNCAGSLLLKAAHLTSAEEYLATIQANLTTAFAVVRAAGKFMSKQGGSVVLVSSAAAQVGLSNHEAIAAAKAGIIGLTLSAAATYAHCQLRFNAVAPGLVETKLTAPIANNEMARKVSAAMHPLGRIGTPQDVAAAITFFLLPENNWITGQVLGVDGGLGHIKPKMKA